MAGRELNINQKKGDAENSWADRAPEINERGDIRLIKSGISCRISHIRERNIRLQCCDLATGP